MTALPFVLYAVYALAEAMVRHVTMHVWGEA
jgi:hypothetical protein